MNEIRAQIALPKIVPGMSEDACDIVYGTTEKWASNDNISRMKTLYVYTDYLELDDGTYLPGLKIGDGKTLISDLPFYFSSSASSVPGTIELTPELEDKIEEILRTRFGFDEELAATIQELLRDKVSVSIDPEEPGQLNFDTFVNQNP